MSCTCMYVCAYYNFHRTNPCAVTRCAYLELMTSLLARPMVIEHPSNIEAAVDLIRQTRQGLLDSMKDEGTSEQDVIVSSCKLLFICTFLHTKPKDLPPITSLCIECLQHSSVAVRQCTVQYILNHSDLLCWEENKFTDLLIKCFSTENDETVLASLCCVLPKTLDVQSPQIGIALYRTAFHHATKNYLRYHNIYNFCYEILS